MLRAFVAQAFRIPSESMVPQLKVGDRVVVSRLSYHLHHPRRGDVVVFDCPPREDCPHGGHRTAAAKAVDSVLEALLLRQPATEEFIKRVIAVPGETVEGRSGSVWINGHRLREPYLAPEVKTSRFAPRTIRKGMVWVMGDNRTNSSDSRVFGQVRMSTIVGRAIWRVWPPNRAAFL